MPTDCSAATAACCARSTRSVRATLPSKAGPSASISTDQNLKIAMSEKPLTPIEIGLTAAIVAIEVNEPRILVASAGAGNEPRAGLPFGPFDPVAHRTLEIGLREWVEEQTGLSLGYIEQLYSFGDRGRHAHLGDTGPHVVSVGYLALTRTDGSDEQRAASA